GAPGAGSALVVVVSSPRTPLAVRITHVAAIAAAVSLRVTRLLVWSRRSVAGVPAPSASGRRLHRLACLLARLLRLERQLVGDVVLVDVAHIGRGLDADLLRH